MHKCKETKCENAEEHADDMKCANGIRETRQVNGFRARRLSPETSLCVFGMRSDVMRCEWQSVVAQSRPSFRKLAPSRNEGDESEKDDAHFVVSCRDASSASLGRNFLCVFLFFGAHPAPSSPFKAICSSARQECRAHSAHFLLFNKFRRAIR